LPSRPVTVVEVSKLDTSPLIVATVCGETPHISATSRADSPGNSRSATSTARRSSAFVRRWPGWLGQQIGRLLALRLAAGVLDMNLDGSALH